MSADAPSPRRNRRTRRFTRRELAPYLTAVAVFAATLLVGLRHQTPVPMPQPGLNPTAVVTTAEPAPDVLPVPGANLTRDEKPPADTPHASAGGASAPTPAPGPQPSPDLPTAIVNALIAALGTFVMKGFR